MKEMKEGFFSIQKFGELAHRIAVVDESIEK